jgi:ABC-type Fe3+-siderophore transport system permease subunit
MKTHLSPFLLLFLALLLSLAIGSVFISPKELWDVLLGAAPKYPHPSCGGSACRAQS